MATQKKPPTPKPKSPPKPTTSTSPPKTSQEKLKMPTKEELHAAGLQTRGEYIRDQVKRAEITQPYFLPPPAMGPKTPPPSGQAEKQQGLSEKTSSARPVKITAEQIAEAGMNRAVPTKQQKIRRAAAYMNDVEIDPNYEPPSWYQGTTQQRFLTQGVTNAMYALNLKRFRHWPAMDKALLEETARVLKLDPCRYVRAVHWFEASTRMRLRPSRRAKLACTLAALDGIHFVVGRARTEMPGDKSLYER